MTKEYVVTGCYIDKVTGKPVSSIAPISSGISKNGQPYEIADVSSRETIEGQYRVGARLSASINFNVQADSGAAQEHRTVKLGGKE